MTSEFIGPFRKSSYSGGQGDCVEVAPLSAGGRAVRDSKNPHGSLLRFTSVGWRTFLGGAKTGAFS